MVNINDNDVCALDPDLLRGFVIVAEEGELMAEIAAKRVTPPRFS